MYGINGVNMKFKTIISKATLPNIYATQTILMCLSLQKTILFCQMLIYFSTSEAMMNVRLPSICSWYHIPLSLIYVYWFEFETCINFIPLFVPCDLSPIPLLLANSVVRFRFRNKRFPMVDRRLSSISLKIITSATFITTNVDLIRNPGWSWVLLTQIHVYICTIHFYPRPVLAFDCCLYLRINVCVCMCLSACASITSLSAR